MKFCLNCNVAGSFKCCGDPTLINLSKDEIAEIYRKNIASLEIDLRDVLDREENLDKLSWNHIQLHGVIGVCELCE